MTEELQDSGKGHGAWNNEHGSSSSLTAVRSRFSHWAQLLQGRGAEVACHLLLFHLCSMGENPACVRTLPTAPSPALECFTSWCSISSWCGATVSIHGPGWSQQDCSRHLEPASAHIYPISSTNQLS